VDHAKQIAEETLASLEEAIADNNNNDAQIPTIIADCETALKTAELEIRTSAANGDVNKQENRIWMRRMKTKLDEAKKATLLRTSSNREVDSTTADRYKEQTLKMQRQKEKLEEARRTLRETEDVAGGIMYDLHSQRETIKSTSAKADQVNSDLSYGNQLLTSMKSWWTFSSIQDKNKG